MVKRKSKNSSRSILTTRNKKLLGAPGIATRSTEHGRYLRTNSLNRLVGGSSSSHSALLGSVTSAESSAESTTEPQRYIKSGRQCCKCELSPLAFLLLVMASNLLAMASSFYELSPLAASHRSHHIYGPLDHQHGTRSATGSAWIPDPLLSAVGVHPNSEGLQPTRN